MIRCVIHASIHGKSTVSHYKGINREYLSPLVLGLESSWQHQKSRVLKHKKPAVSDNNLSTHHWLEWLIYFKKQRPLHSFFDADHVLFRVSIS